MASSSISSAARPRPFAAVPYTPTVSDLPARVLLLENGGSNRTLSIDRYTTDLQAMLASADLDVRRRGAPWYPAIRPGPRAQQRAMTGFASAFDPSLVHTTSSWMAAHLVKFRELPTVATCHDVIPFVQPGWSTRRIRGPIDRWFLRQNAPGYRAATRIIAVSQWSADTLCAWAQVDPAKITVIPNVVSDSYQPVADPDAVLAAAGIHLPPTKRILVIGSAEPRKNIDIAIRALAEPALSGATLVRTGGLRPEHRDLIARLGLGARVHETGFVPEEALPALYSACDVLLQPSSFEGFGLPPAEAMACGTPSVVADSSALPGVVADAGLVVPMPGAAEDDARAFATAIERILSDATLASELSRRGIERVNATFRAAAILPRVLDVYRQALEQHT